jgi:DNA-binding CsgD family transcriptional regulator
MERNQLFDLFESVAKCRRLEEGHAVLREALSNYGLTHVAYCAVNLPTTKRARPLIAVTYAPEWVRHYLQEGYVNIDPVVRAGLCGILPVDWASLDLADPVIAKFFGEAQEFKIGPNGLSVPVRGRHGEFALFSVSSDINPSEWLKIKKLLMRDLMMLAYHFHDWALGAEGIERHDYLTALSTREKDCLKWKALRKSDWDLSQAIGISERTVKFHLESARAKLGAVNTTHAVAKAISFGLIVIP